MKDVVAVVDDHVAGEVPGIAYASLALSLHQNGDAGGRRRFGLGHGQHLLAGVFRKVFLRGR
jgi:hypothetical protein